MPDGREAEGRQYGFVIERGDKNCKEIWGGGKVILFLKAVPFAPRVDGQ